MLLGFRFRPQDPLEYVRAVPNLVGSSILLWGRSLLGAASCGDSTMCSIVNVNNEAIVTFLPTMFIVFLPLSRSYFLSFAPFLSWSSAALA